MLDGRNIRYCDKCGRAMGFRLDPLPEVWRQSWQCLSCDNKIIIDCPRYTIGRVNKEKKDRRTEKEHGQPAEEEKKQKYTSDVQDSSAGAEQLMLNLEPTTAECEPVKRKRGRPRKIVPAE